MARGSILSFLSVNRSLTPAGGEIRQLRLPRHSPFPKLNPPTGGAAVSPAPVRGAVVLGSARMELPEMATDLIDPAAGYAVENVKRDRAPGRARSGVGFRQFLGRVLGQTPAVR